MKKYVRAGSRGIELHLPLGAIRARQHSFSDEQFEVDQWEQKKEYTQGELIKMGFLEKKGG
jgi:hypothetical protein